MLRMNSEPASHSKVGVALLLLWPLLGGCQVKGQDGMPPLEYNPQVISLSLTGYNYTNRYIDTFSVNGQGGGNLFVSSPTSGGGGTTCCVSHVAGMREKTVTVRWQSGGCKYHTKSRISDEIYDNIHSFFKETEVKVDGLNTANPKVFEVHFYPDGSVKAAITEQASRPRLALPKERADRSSYPRCPNDAKPAD